MSDTRPQLDAAMFDAVGLNLIAVFDLDALPVDMAAALRAAAASGSATTVRQAILIGHGGPGLWSAVQAAEVPGDDPIDDFTVGVVRRWIAAMLPGRDACVLYPGPARVGLQALGRIAGWHHDSPFMVGINQRFGSWFAYRALLVTDSDFRPGAPMTGDSPCVHCAARPCVAACPAGALGMAGERFDLERCIAYRSADGSRCASTCIARTTCPVGSEHRYPEAQIRHSYGRSLADLRRWLA
jgi:hypothetical protein